MWANRFDKILLINLPRRTDRLASASAQLLKYNIPFELVPGIEQENADGAYGIWFTLKQIFSDAISAGIKRLLIFEDDLKFVEDPNYYLPWMLDQLEEQKDWHIFYLGPNTHKPLNQVAPNLLLAEQCRGLHAVAYSYDGMLAALQNMQFYYRPIDTVFESRMQTKGNCYTAFPLLATQANGYSDIDKKQVKNNYIVDRFKENTKHIK